MACSCVVPSWGEAALYCSLWIVNQVLVRLWTRRTSRVALALLHPCGAGWLGAGAGGPWLYWHGCLTQSMRLSLCGDGSMPDCWCGCSVQRRLNVCAE